MALLNQIHSPENQPGSVSYAASMMTGISYGLFFFSAATDWIVDSGSSDHITPHLSLFKTHVVLSRPHHITMPNGHLVKVKHIGTMSLNSELILDQVLHVPDFHFGLISTSKLVSQLSANVIFTFQQSLLQVPSHAESLGSWESI